MGPRIEPFGTPLDWLAGEEEKMSQLTENVLFLRYEEI